MSSPPPTTQTPPDEDPIMNESSWEIASVVTTNSIDDPEGNQMSETVRIITEDASSFSIRRAEHHPKANKHFMIRERQAPHRIVTLSHGRVKLIDKPSIGGGWLWLCVKSGGWYGFVNTVSNTYLGHNGEGEVIAAGLQHLSHESFVVDRHEDGGYVLFMTRFSEDLRPMAISQDGNALVEERADAAGTAWDFVEDSQINHFHL
ncbi:hypothetical protein MKX07_006153 [Trichoderma sp. CBMAI-0711]|uniref:Uncharacterized protein n=1 Tax=Trichoderma parareesei TaxID=858221 RepID=A0A2H2Z634_TRIPA|nr:hypothetical protein MKX07_006153 [Trichoderma sp. CBMAI-0711]OTA03547.1 hypothetical protein A9Z42_0040390 [Trichoderma parareesei]